VLLKRLGVGAGITLGGLAVAALWVLIRTRGLSIAALANTVFYLAAAFVVMAVVMLGVRERPPGMKGKEKVKPPTAEAAQIGWYLAVAGVLSMALSILMGSMS
jgi:hypothetical protein